MAKDRWDHKPKDPACTDKVDRVKIDLDKIDLDKIDLDKIDIEIDIDKIDLNALWPYLSSEAIIRAARSYIRAGGRDLRGLGFEIFEQSFETLRVKYEKDRNPLYAWVAYNGARENGTPVPAWVLEYLDEAAEEICVLADCGGLMRRKISHTDIAKAIKLAGTQGKGNPFSSYKNDFWMAISKTVVSNLLQGDKETYAIEAAAKQGGVSVSTVRRAWKRYQAEFPERVLEILSSTKHPIS